MRFARDIASLLVILVSAIVCHRASAQVFTYTFSDVTTLTNSSAGATVSNVTFSSFTRSAAVGGNANAANRFSFTNWPTGATNGSDTFTGSIDLAKYFEFTITPAGGFVFDVSDVTFAMQRSGTGVRQFSVRGSTDSFGNNLSAAPGSGGVITVVPSNVFQTTDASNVVTSGNQVTLGSSFDNVSVLSPVTFRFYGWNAEMTGGTFSVDDVAIFGTVSPATLYWDTSAGAGTGGFGGTAAWSSTAANWNQDVDGAAARIAYTPNNPLVFGGPAGTVNINPDHVSANAGITFDSTGYLIQSSSAKTLTLGANPAFEVSAAWHVATISARITGSNGLIKNGAGELVLTNSANSYSGVTTINAGRLSVNNPGLLPGNVQVNANGTLGGTGTVGGTVTVAGTIAPGNSVGQITTGAELWNGGGNYEWEIDDTTGSQGASPGWDHIQMSSLAISATPGEKFTITIKSLPAGNPPANWPAGGIPNAPGYIRWVIATATGGVSGFDPNAFNIDYNSFFGAASGGHFIIALENSGKEIALYYVPEPGGASILVMGAALFLRRRTRAVVQ